MNKVSKLKTIKNNKTKGRQNVEKKLIESAAVLVGSIGKPLAIRTRIIKAFLYVFLSFQSIVNTLTNITKRMPA